MVLYFVTGEDRWLCTLLLQQGYRVDYTAAADALTHAPETMNEFFKQRRRWIPSTLANLIDLLSDYENTIFVNDNVSALYIAYELLLLISTVLGPATIILAIAQACVAILGVSILPAFIISLAPCILYLIVCFTLSDAKQLIVAGIFSTMYACVMVAVLIGTIHGVVAFNSIDPGFFFLLFMAVSFIFAGILHPYEFLTLGHGILYFLCIPAGYLLLMVYSLTNLHIISWGTREVQSNNRKDKENKKMAKKDKKKGWFSFLRADILVQEMKVIINQIFNKEHEVSAQNEMIKILRAIHEDIKQLNHKLTNELELSITETNDDVISTTDLPVTEEENKLELQQQKSLIVQTVDKAVVVNEQDLAAELNNSNKLLVSEDPLNPGWMKAMKLGNCPVDFLAPGEYIFWQDLLKKYLKPIEHDELYEARISEELKNLRNNMSFFFWFVNLLWLLINFMITQDARLSTVYFYVGGFKLSTQPLGFVYLILFSVIILLQVISMTIHSLGTFVQLISITELRKQQGNNSASNNKMTDGSTINEISPEDAIKMTKEILGRHSMSVASDDSSIINQSFVSESDDNSESIHPHMNKALYGTIRRRVKSIRKRNEEHEIPPPAEFASNVHPDTGVENLQQRTRQQFDQKFYKRLSRWMTENETDTAIPNHPDYYCASEHL